MKQTAMSVEVSGNKKIGRVSVINAPFSTCHTDCPWLNNGCYASYGPVSIQERKLDHSASPLEVAREEARLMGELKSGLDLRLHVFGDSRTRAGTKILARAAREYMKRWGKKIWTYTHAWRRVQSEDWGQISVLASCETADHVREAWSRGYAAAIVVDSHPGEKAYLIDGIKVIPCPAESREVTCESCRLCMNSDRLRENKLAIGFSAHGSGAKRVKNTLSAMNAQSISELRARAEQSQSKRVALQTI
jgi:hypothetical protein